MAPYWTCHPNDDDGDGGGDDGVDDYYVADVAATVDSLNGFHVLQHLYALLLLQ